ncbi:MAG TPA: cell division protein [Lachnospiraceae bacterium]|jgi:cell division protein FtsW|nr:cell division protein [Lachnospiraceae bacterium]
MASNRNSKRRKNNVISYDAYLNGDLDNRNYQRVEYRTTSNNERNKRARTKSAERFAKLKDYSLLFTLLLLIIFGLIMLYSTSSYEAYATYSDSAYYFKKQLQASLLGLGVMLLVAIFPYRYLDKMAVFLYFASVLLVLMIIPFGRTVNGARRWIYIGSLSIQPAEISKITVIILTARILCRTKLKRYRGLIGWIKLFFRVMWPSIVQAGLLYSVTRNMSSAMIVLFIGLGMLFVASRKVWPYFLLAGLGAGAGAVWIRHVISADQAATAASTTSDISFRGERILAWLEPEKYSGETAFQTLQALYGIGSGGIFGKGLGNSVQKLGYIPEAQNDMIFSVICEELGIFGAFCVIAIFILLCYQILTIAENASDEYGGLLASGVMVHIAIQVILNIAVVTNTIPNTGVTLPFISYGGTSVVLLLAEMGMVMSVSRNIRLQVEE